MNNQQIVKKPKKRRRRGSGSLLKMRGHWVIRWRDGGVLKQETTPFAVGAKDAKANAEALLAERCKLNALKTRRDQVAVLLAERDELEAKIARLERIAKGEAGPLTLGELVEAWKKSPRRKDCGEAQTDRYARQIGAFVKWAGAGVRVADVGDELAEGYAANLAAKSAGGTYNKHINALDACWRAVGRSAGCRGNPWAELPRKRLEAASRRALTVTEVEKVLEIAEGEIKALILIGLRTGLRLGDACRLKWAAFKDSGVVEVKTIKTGALVALPGEKLKEEISRLSPRADSGYVLPGMAAMYKADPARVSKAVEAVFRKAGIETSERRKGWSKARPLATFHSLRHTFVSRAVERGVPVAIVKALVGHTRETMTDHYTHVAAAAIFEAFQKAEK